MKLAVALVCLSVAVMVVMIYQAVRQEMNLRDLKSRMVENAAEVKRKEESIVETKGKIQTLKQDVLAVNKKVDALWETKKTKTNSEAEFKKNLASCNTEKASAENKKTETGEAIKKLQDEQEVAKKKAEEDIKSLKQQILDRDKAICAFVDTTKEEARKLCGITETPK
ncbi:uncharacterized protein si:dkey-87o1.2 [Centropristis striata]|uniref:uncharacterized protein si:dkey-87o1.2 n=1 Tax=Centropristis striata TaxID=184440 RepID=UPI0027E11E7A|nr:uncharacterized protein si:dkey-87o1.2 [Centropristis striata]